MTTINLREFYPWYIQDEFIEVSDEVAAELRAGRRPVRHSTTGASGRFLFGTDCPVQHGPNHKKPVVPAGRSDCRKGAGTFQNHPLQAIALSRLERRGNLPAGIPGDEGRLGTAGPAPVRVLERLTAERAELANGVDNEHPALVAFMKHQNINALSREILIELIDQIKVYENGNISVRFKFADELRKIAEYIESNTTDTPAKAVQTFPSVCFPIKTQAYH